ncbi:MAG: cobyrinate a,c-diamide synthase [Pseudomonadota bacterium]|nr:cobyrinate a,c-diamide synthase [Pseudomonadota bacterium]
MSAAGSKVGGHDGPAIPGLLVAAPGSGHGKTTALCGIAAALGGRGVDVRTFKAGPDYLDPTWHRRVTGRPSRNLDAWMTGKDGVWASFARGVVDVDSSREQGALAIVEGVMGLFDGRDPRGLDGSGAELALLLGLPVILVVDAAGMARSAAAVVEGFARHVAGVDVVGVVFNRVGSAGHTRILREAIEALPDFGKPRVRVLGGLPKAPDLAVPERHLGLVSAEHAAGHPGADPDWARRLGDWAGEHLDLDAILALARPVARVADVSSVGRSPSPPRIRIGVAQDAAFHFYYPDNLDLLREAGAELVPFSPLADNALPGGLDGLYLGGGYPEAHAAELEANAPIRAAVRRFSGAVYAECGGLMFLGESLDDRAMCGVLPLRTTMGAEGAGKGRLRALGYREVVTTRDTVLGPAGTMFRGHEFHYSALAGTPGMAPAYRMKGRTGETVEGWATDRVLGSYVHAHFGSNPALATSFVAACEAHRGR